MIYNGVKPKPGWLKKTKVKKIVTFLLKKEHIKKPLTVVFTDDKTIKRVNRIYRYKNEPTDVLSFEYGKSSDVLGEIIISLQTAKKQAVKYGNSILKETLILVIHGFYHVLGYKHYKKADYKKMRKKEDAALGLLIKKRMLI
ncbi:MAG: rRNA maturation RNase YbeY [Candidatus Firestonebacteria bacterium RIFOXYA2_FULL_40_8]|nr:MAG: rRNA maturation RNase YbeY [Candidatus Firestonebacteria bacterium RIFOXYA2_FULL_40_8]